MLEVWGGGLMHFLFSMNFRGEVEVAGVWLNSLVEKTIVKRTIYRINFLFSMNNDLNS